MNIVFLILLMQRNAVYTPQILPSYTPHLYNKNCYMSNSNPHFFVEIWHKFKISPPYICLVVNYELKSLIYHKPSINDSTVYHFIKDDRNCTSTLMLTMKGERLSVLRLSISIYLSIFTNKMAEISYIFTSGFIPGMYQLNDTSLMVALSVNVLYNGTENIQRSDNTTSVKLLYRQLSSLNSDGDLCVLTEQNQVFFIKPQYGFEKPKGLVTHIAARYVLEGRIVAYFQYTAFECKIMTQETVESLYLVDDQPKNAILNFSTIFMIFNTTVNIGEASFTLNNIKRQKYNRLETYSISSKNLILMNTIPEILPCPDGTIRFTYITTKGDIYYAKESRFIDISSTVKQKKWIHHSSLNPCDK